MIPLTKTLHSNLKKFFFILTTWRHESLQGLNSSLAQSDAELWLAKLHPKRENYAFAGTFWIWTKTGFLTHNFGYRYASKSTKGSTDADMLT